MSTKEHIITGMWGTSNLTLSLIDAETGEVTAKKEGPGISMLKGAQPEGVFFDLAKLWVSEFGVERVLLSGMAGANIGWKNVPYLRCPIDINSVKSGVHTFEARGVSVSIIPGLSCENPLGQNDVMRGEETELLAWFATATNEQRQQSIVCVPGTHAKWVHIKNNRVENFLTSVVGETYQVLTSNGVLAQPHCQKPVQSTKVFLQAVRDVIKCPANLLNLLFSARANAVCGDFSGENSTDYLSGLLIGSDLNAAIECFGRELMEAPIPLIGANYLVERYAQAMMHLGLEAIPMNSAEIGAKGLFSVYETIKASGKKRVSA